jgi:hypothetical protein
MSGDNRPTQKGGEDQARGKGFKARKREDHAHHMVRNLVGSLVERSVAEPGRPSGWEELLAARAAPWRAGQHRPRGWCSCACSTGLTAELPNA